jgi:hypothetical protein
VTQLVTTTRALRDLARRPQTLRVFWPAETGPVATASDETGVHGVQRVDLQEAVGPGRLPIPSVGHLYDSPHICAPIAQFCSHEVAGRILDT